MARQSPRAPSELQQHILLLSIDPLTSSTYKERYATLRNYSLVSRDWRALAQAELFSSVVIPPRASALRLLRSLEPGGYLSGKVTAMRVGSAGKRGHAVKFRLWDLLVLCGNLQELWVRRLDGIELDCFEQAAHSLTSLCIASSTIESPSPSSPPLHFPRLKHLHLEQTTLSNLTLASLTRTAFPALTSLAWEAIQRAEEWFNEEAKQLALETLPDLFALSVNAYALPFKSMNSLVVLCCDEFDLQTPQLPSSLHFVRPVCHFGDCGTLVRILTRYSDLVKKWEELRVPQRLVGGRGWEELGTLCGEMGIRLVVEREREEMDDDHPMRRGFWALVDEVERQRREGGIA